MEARLRVVVFAPLDFDIVVARPRNLGAR